MKWHGHRLYIHADVASRSRGGGGGGGAMQRTLCVQVDRGSAYVVLCCAVHRGRETRVWIRDCEMSLEEGEGEGWVWTRRESVSVCVYA